MLWLLVILSVETIKRKSRPAGKGFPGRFEKENAVISTCIPCEPTNDNYKRLAIYICAGHYQRELEKDQELIYVKRYAQPYTGSMGNLAGNRLRELSQYGLASRIQGGKEEFQRRTKREFTSLLSFDARTNRRAPDFVRRYNDFSATKVKNEKCLMAWCAGCLAGDDYKLGIQEVLDVQALNSRTTKEKTYHLLVSFRPEDEMKLSPEVFKAIEERFAAALGYAEHQRHCGVHKNTAHIHMHVAYNMIHPERFTRHEPFRDYIVRDNVCRQLEKKFGLVVDNGREKRRDNALSRKAAVMEAHSGQESFESYAKRHKDILTASLETAMDWQALHEACAELGLELVPRANGLAIKDRHGKHAMKASGLGRGFSMKKLEAKLGPYMSAKELTNIIEKSRYQARPLHRAPERGNLYAIYRKGIEERIAELKAVKDRETEELKALRAKYERIRKDIDRKTDLTSHDRRALIQASRKKEAAALDTIRQKGKKFCEEIQEKFPFKNWNQFLRMEAERGNEIALSILQSRGEVVSERKPEGSESEWTADISPETALPQTWKERRNAIRARTDLTHKDKKSLLAVSRMYQLIEREKSRYGFSRAEGFTYRVDNCGVVLFTLRDGGMIRDTGTELTFSAHDPEAKKIAEALGRLKFGIKFHRNGNVFTKGPAREKKRDPEKEDEVKIEL